jgi:hypothetical protein
MLVSSEICGTVAGYQDNILLKIFTNSIVQEGWGVTLQTKDFPAVYYRYGNKPIIEY